LIKKYRKKPVVVEAIQYLGEENIFQVQEWFKKNKSSRDLIYKPETNEYYIKTLEGEYILTDGDYIIKGIKGEFYPCKPDIFHATYKEVER
jgi:hypothetical protein